MFRQPVFILAVLLLAIACTARPTTTQAVELGIDKDNVKIAETNTTEVVAQQPEKPEAKLISTGNTTLTSADGVQRYNVKGDDHTIQLLDVTDDGKGCMITVDGTMDIIDKGESKEVNGVKITVMDVVILHSYSEDNDMCEVAIR